MVKNRNWNLTALSDLVTTKSCNMPGKEQIVWNLSLEDIESQTGTILKRQATKVGDLGSSKCCFDDRYVLYSKLRPYLNKVVLPDSPGVGTSELIPMLPDESKISRKYLAFYLRSPAFVQFANEHSRGANLPRIAMKALWKHEVPHPQEIEKQHQIVDRIEKCLNCIQHSSELVKRVDKQLRELKTATVLGKNYEDRTWIPAGEVVEWIQDSERVKPDTKYQFAGIKSFGRGLFAREIRTSKDFAYPNLRRLRTGDFIYPKLMAWEGAFAMVPPEFDGFVVSPEFVVFRANEPKVCPEVLDAYFRSSACLDSVVGASTGSNRRRRRLNPNSFLKLKIPVPDAATQSKLKGIYEYESVSSRERSERSVKLTSLRDAVLRKAFAGEL